MHREVNQAFDMGATLFPGGERLTEEARHAKDLYRDSEEHCRPFVPLEKAPSTACVTVIGERCIPTSGAVSCTRAGILRSQQVTGNQPLPPLNRITIGPSGNGPLREGVRPEAVGCNLTVALDGLALLTKGDPLDVWVVRAESYREEPFTGINAVPWGRTEEVRGMRSFIPMLTWGPIIFAFRRDR